MAILRTKIILLVIINLIAKNFCDSDALKNYSIHEKAELLLRGSDEEKEFVINKAIEDSSKEPEEKNFEEDFGSTTEESTTTSLPDTESTKYDDSKNIDPDHFNSKRTDDDFNTSAIPPDATTTTDDNDVFRTTAPEEIYMKTSTSNNIDVKAETTTPRPTTTGAELPEPRIALDEEPPAQRSPKTENTAPIEEERRVSEARRAGGADGGGGGDKRATLRAWLQDAWLRAPAGLLVPLRSAALARALALWTDLAAPDPLNITDIVIVGYDSDGVSWRSRHSLQGSRHSLQGSGGRVASSVPESLSKLLLKFQGVDSEGAPDGTMKALSTAAKLVPYDSALFVITDRGAGDPDHLPLALRALVEKRLKVYTIWTDPNHPSQESVAALAGLRNVSTHTEGDVLPYSLQLLELEDFKSEQSWDPMDTSRPRQARLHSAPDEQLETLLIRRGGGGVTSLGIPVEHGVSALRVYIEGAVEHAVLYPPNDAPQIDLFNTSSVRAFSAGSRTDGNSPRDVFLVFPGADPVTDVLSVVPMSGGAAEWSPALAGAWHLSVRCDSCDYRLSVAARALLRFTARLHTPDKLKIRVTGPVSSVRESSLVDEYGKEVAKLPYSYQPLGVEGQQPPSPAAELEAALPLPRLAPAHAHPLYAKIVGRDIRGEPFVRYSGPVNRPEARTGRSALGFLDSVDDLERTEEANSLAYSRLRYNNSIVLPNNRAVSQVVNQRGTLLTAVQVGLGSRLYGAPGDTLQLHFEVTNYRDQNVRFTFEAIGELRFLRGITPSSQTVVSGQTANVIVSVGITATAQPGARDLITFTAYGVDQVSISAYVYVVNSVDGTDVWAPEVRHNFQGMCVGRLGADCAQHVWSATVVARDALGGLLRLTSSPAGLVYDGNFIAGTREEVTAAYRATCCAPRLLVTAVDAYGNVNGYVIDITSYLNDAAIAAIVLGVFLLIAIIALVVFLVWWCVRRRKESRELPYATSTRNIN